MAKKKSRRRKKKQRWSGRLRRFAPWLLAAGVVGVLAAAWLLWPFWQLSTQLAAAGGQQASQLYGKPLRMEAGSYLSRQDVIRELEGQGYRSTEAVPETGRFRANPGTVEVNLRPFPTPAGWSPGGPLGLRWSGRRLVSIAWRGQEVERATLEPPRLASYLGADRREMRAVSLEEIPEHLIHAVLAAEDAGFYRHVGLSVTGIARAAWVNLSGGEVRQGGSTLTQQLVKNLFLTHERTWARKVREVLLAVLVDLRYEKEEILEAYLNEIYWGSADGVNLMGIGSAAWAYFGKRAPELDLCESALLAAVIRSPGSYSPTKNPGRAQERRDWVLERMGEKEWLEPERLAAAKECSLGLAPRRLPTGTAPYFAGFAAAEAEERFGVNPRASPGYVLLSTLEAEAQKSAQEAVAWGLEALEEGWEKGTQHTGPLQAALVSVDPESGEILAYIGGRDYRRSQFDRAGSALRQAGSAFKPVVYAAAFDAGQVSTVTPVEDSPITVVLAGRRWSPKNSDSSFRGWITVRTALEKSLNIPTVRVALDTGLPAVVEMARSLGVSSKLQPVPALALGAFEVTPLDLTQVYATLAAGGVRRPLYGVRAVLDGEGNPVAGAPLAPPERAMSPQAAYLVTSLLQGVLDRGTAAGVRKLGLHDALAGKTGTTNDRRDSWFAGYSPNRATLVWVGYDDASATRLSGARAALPIWARFTWKVRPSGGYPAFIPPSGVTTASIDPASGELATGSCPEVFTEVFVDGTQPTYVCRLHSTWRDWPQSRPEWVDKQRRRRPLRWLRKILGRQARDKGPV